MKEEDLKQLKDIAKSSGSKILSSRFFLSLYTRDFSNDPVCALQLGIAIMLDKPIGILAPQGSDLPDHLKKIALIEYYDANHEDSLKLASLELIGRLGEIGK